MPCQAVEPDAQKRPSVILISLDTLRADHLGCFGYGRLSTPHIDELAQGGTLFAGIDSQVPLTVPSHAVLFTSTYPFVNHVQENEQGLAPGAATLAGVLRLHGYRTAAIIGGYFLARRFGLDQGFDLYDDGSFSKDRPPESAADLKRPAPEVIRRASEWLDRESSRPFFLFVHLFDLHRPYNAPPRYAAKGRSEYDAELAYVDDTIGEFERFLARQGLFNNTLIVFTSDHGESLEEHGESTHGYFIYESTLHVPLIVRWPAAHSQYRALTGVPAGLIDVAPTVLEFLSIPLPAQFQGHSLLPQAGLSSPSALPDQAVYSESLYPHDTFGWAPLRGIRLGKYHFIEAPHAELYDLDRDPTESHNLIGTQQALATTLRAKLQELKSRYAAGSWPGVKRVTNPQEVESLRSLGYLELSTPKVESGESQSDPKDRIDEYRLYERGHRLLLTGRIAEAIPTFKELLIKDASNPAAHDALASCYREAGRLYDAERELKAALAVAPRDVHAGELLSEIYLQMKDYGRAQAEYQWVLSLNPDDYAAQYGLGIVADGEGHPDQAIQSLRSALRIYPCSPEAHYRLGIALEEKKQMELAKREFQRALQCDPRFSTAQTALAGMH
jgi:arylsulfatase A-like enzyme/Tfp pilus assembly protein PilF